MANEVKQGALHFYDASHQPAQAAAPAAPHLSEADVCAIFRLLIKQAHDINVLRRFPSSVCDNDDELKALTVEFDDCPAAPKIPNPQLVELFAAPGAETELGGGRKVNNRPILERARAFITAPENCTRVLTTHFAHVFVIKVRNGYTDPDDASQHPTEIFIREIHNEGQLHRLKTAFATPRFATEIDHLWGTFFRPTPLDHGYAFFKTNNGDYELSWFDQWSDMAFVAKVMHFDIKSSEIYRGNLINLDNYLVQLAGKAEFLQSDRAGAYHGQDSAVAAEIAQVLRMAGSQTGFWIRGQYMHAYLISSHPVDLAKLGRVLDNPIKVRQWMDNYPEVKARKVSLVDFDWSNLRVAHANPADPGPFKVPFYLDAAVQQAGENDAIWRGYQAAN